MHDIWNPWHGCKKISEGCANCYMYFLDKMRDQNGANIYRTKNGFDYPLQKNRHGSYKIQSGETVRVCMTSDFFLAEADQWREEAWSIIWQRPDVKFLLLTKRPERVAACLPRDWGQGWENVFFNVTCENQRRADERLPLLLELPFKHKGVFCAPFIGPVSLAKYLASGQIEQVTCGGENYDGARPCDFAWVKNLSRECAAYNVSFYFFETGTRFIKDGREYFIPNKQVQSHQAHKAGVNVRGRPAHYKLCDGFGRPISRAELHQPRFGLQCQGCGSQPICNGCANCGRCTALSNPANRQLTFQNKIFRP